MRAPSAVEKALQNIGLGLLRQPYLLDFVYTAG
jgi:hypothetical protein